MYQTKCEFLSIGRGGRTKITFDLIQHFSRWIASGLPNWRDVCLAPKAFGTII